jgi:hypothetical protein
MFAAVEMRNRRRKMLEFQMVVLREGDAKRRPARIESGFGYS